MTTSEKVTVAISAVSAAVAVIAAVYARSQAGAARDAADAAHKQADAAEASLALERERFQSERTATVVAEDAGGIGSLRAESMTRHIHVRAFGTAAHNVVVWFVDDEGNGVGNSWEGAVLIPDDPPAVAQLTFRPQEERRPVAVRASWTDAAGPHEATVLTRFHL